MNVISAGGSLWLPQRRFGDNLVLNTSHWAYPFLVAAIVPSDGSFKPVIYRGPAGLAAFPISWASGGLASNVMGSLGPALSFAGASSTQILLSSNKAIFNGLTTFSFVGCFQDDTGSNGGSGADVFRKDGELTSVQYGGDGSIHFVAWATGATTVNYPTSPAANDIVRVGASRSGTSLVLYQSINNGAISTATGVIGAAAVPSNAGTPFCIGGSEGASELFTGKVFYGYWFNRNFTADQMAALFADPAALFLPSEAELPALFVSGATAYTLPAAAGSYALTGTAATLKVARLVTTAAGSYAFTGTAATLRRNLPLVAGAGSYALTGTAASVLHNWLLGAAAGSYALTGTAASVKHGYAIAAGAGSYSLTGTAAALLHKWVLPAAAGSYVLTGSAATLTKTSGATVAAGVGSYALTGQAVSLVRTYILSAGSTSYVMTGTAANLTQATPPPPAPPGTALQGGIGSGGGGAKWERVSSSDGAKPGQLSVKEQNKKELRELEEIEREIARQEQITARKAELALEQAALKEEIKTLRVEDTAMAAAFARAGLVLPAEMEEPEIDDDEEEILLLVMATLH